MRVPKSTIQTARQLRKDQTSAEAILWQHLRDRQFKGFKFLRQHPIGVQSERGKKHYFIPDFYCKEVKLIVELDGEVHNKIQQKEYDELRTEIIKTLGVTVLRFENEEVETNIKGVLEKIEKLTI